MPIAPANTDMCLATIREDAMRSAKKRAAELGATHLVGNFDIGSGITMEASTIKGRAYRCPEKP